MGRESRKGSERREAKCRVRGREDEGMVGGERGRGGESEKRIRERGAVDDKGDG